MIKLIRKQNEIYTESGEKCRIVPQATKGPNKEVVYIGGLEGSNGQKWISLTKLVEGLNEIECHGKEVSTYSLTAEERAQIEALEAQIKQIKDNAKARYAKTSKKSINDMSIEELEAFIAQRKRELGKIA